MESPETDSAAQLSTALREKALIQAKAGDFTKALVTARQIEEKEQIEALREIASIASAELPVMDRRTFLKLPVSERNALLARQAAIVAEHFLPGSEQMEWVEEYIEYDNWEGAQGDKGINFVFVGATASLG